MSHFQDKTFFVDNSAIELLTTCPWRAYASIIRKRTLVAEQPALRFGGHIHAALAYRYRRIAQGKVPCPDVQMRILSTRFARTPLESEEWRNVNTAQDVITSYNERYSSEPLDTDVVHHNGFPLVEKPFAVIAGERLGWRIVYIGRIDMAFRDGGHLYVRDHKTSSVLGQTYWQDVAVSEQQRGYCWALRETLGEEPLGYEINVLCARKPSRTGNAIEFARQKVFTREPPNQLDVWRDNMLAQVETFLWHVNKNIFPRHHKHCIHKYGVCPFYSVCELPPQTQEQALTSSAYQENTWSPLYK